MNEPMQHQALCLLCGIRPPWTDHMNVCGVCLGFEQAKEDPLPAYGVTNYDPAVEKAARVAEQRKAERPCSSCGRTPIQTKFYPSRPDKCVECIKARVKSSLDDAPKTYTEIVEEPGNTPPLDPIVSAEIDAQPDLPPESNNVPAETSPVADCTCRECGVSFEAYRNGVAIVINYCRDCLKARLKRGLRKAGDLAAPNFKIVLDLEQDPEIFEALTLAAKRDRRSLDNQVITLLERSLIQHKGVAPC